MLFYGITCLTLLNLTVVALDVKGLSPLLHLTVEVPDTGRLHTVHM